MLAIGSQQWNRQPACRATNTANDIIFFHSVTTGVEVDDNSDKSYALVCHR